MNSAAPTAEVRPARAGGLRTWAGYAVSLALLALLIRSLDPAALAAVLGEADFRLLPLAVGLYFVGLLVRSVRWSLLLPPGAVTVQTLFRALAIGFTINNLLPARLGEVARAYLLNRWAGVAYGITLASVVVERVLDGLTLVVLLLVAIALVPSPPGYLPGIGATVGAAFLGISLVLALAAWQPRLLDRATRTVAQRLPVRAGDLLVRVAASFVEGLRGLRGPGVLLRLAALSLLGWLAELSLFYVIMVCFPFAATFPLAVLIGTAANFATLIPSSPGYVGTFDSVLVKVLSDTTAVPNELAAAYALVVHAALFLPVTLLGAFLLWRADLSFAQVAQLHRPTPEAKPAHSAKAS